MGKNKYLSFKDISNEEFDELVINTRFSQNNELLVFKLNGKKMRTKECLMNEFSSVFQFPDYFGNNYDALSDCMEDLSWFNFKAITLCFTHANEILAEYPIQEKDIFCDILNEAALFWNNPFDVDEKWGHNIVPFNIIMQGKEE